MLHPRTDSYAAMHWNLAEFWPMSIDPGDDTGYWRLLHRFWAMPGDLVVIEQDMLPGPRVISGMLRCDAGWCTSAYPIVNGTPITEGLGVARFSHRLKTAMPELIERVGEMDEGCPARDWHWLDIRIARLLKEAGHTPHVHGTSTHLHDYAARP